VPVDTNIPVGHASALRGSERVAIAIAVEVSGIDLSGNSFHEEACTEHVTRNGASIVLRRSVLPEQQVGLRCGRRSAETPARIVGLISRRKEDNVYGVSLIQPDANFWGIFFPPQSEIDAALVRLPLQCAACGNREVVLLDELEFTVFAASGKLSRKCRHCAHPTSWETIPNSSSHKRSELKPRAHAAPESESWRASANRDGRTSSRWQTSRAEACVFVAGASTRLMPRSRSPCLTLRDRQTSSSPAASPGSGAQNLL